MEKLVKALLNRLVPGQGPGMDVPQRSVMEGGPESSLGSFRQGGGRGLLDILGGAWDIPVQAANTLPGLPGLVLRTAAGGKSKLPTDAVAEATGLAGKGAAYDAGRASVNALAALGAGKVNMELPGPGTLNMWIGPSTPGYSFRRAKEVADELKGLKNPKAMATAASRMGASFDPGSRKILLPLDTSKWEFNPDAIARMSGIDSAGTMGKVEDVPFMELFRNPDVTSALPEAVRQTVFRADPLRNPNSGVYRHHEGRAVLGLPRGEAGGIETPTTSPDFRKSIFHEAQHALEMSQGTSKGGNTEYARKGIDNLLNLAAVRKGNLDVLRIGNPELPARRALPLAFRDALSQYDLNPEGGNPAYRAYRAMMGEAYARGAEEISIDGLPKYGLNVYSRARLEGMPPLMGNTPIALSDHLAELKARHPKLFKQALQRWPNLEEMHLNENLRQELLGLRQPFGIRFKQRPPEIPVENSSPSKPMPSPESAPRPKPERVFPDSHEDAMKLMEQGFQLFAFHEMGGGKIPITSVDMLNAYAPDQIMALKRSKGIAVPLPKSKN